MKIQSLSKKNLKETINLIKQIFNSKDEDFDSPTKWLPASLNPDLKKSEELYKNYNTIYLKYYVGIDEKSRKIIGVTGIYTREEDEKDSAWLPWYCVHPDFRGKGYGNMLVDFSIDLAKKMNKKYLKVYTSYNLDIKDAMSMYKKKGFKIDKIENYPNTKEEMVFMSCKL